MLLDSGASLCMEGGQGDPHQLLHFVFNHHYLGGLNGLIQGKKIDTADLARPEPRHALEHPLSHRLMGNYAEADDPLPDFKPSGTDGKPNAFAAAGQEMPSPSSSTCPPWRAFINAWQYRCCESLCASSGHFSPSRSSLTPTGKLERPRVDGHLDSHFPPSFDFICLHCPFSLCLFPSRCSFARFTRRVPLRTLPRRSQTWSDLSPGGPP